MNLKNSKCNKKTDETAPHDVVLVLDATSGQNIINQLEEFNKIIKITGLIMTKLDGTAKVGTNCNFKKYKVQFWVLALEKKKMIYKFLMQNNS